MRKQIVEEQVLCDMCKQDISHTIKFAIKFGKDTYDLCSCCKDITKLVLEFVDTKTSLIINYKWVTTVKNDSQN